MGAQWKAKGKDLAANAKGRMFGKLAKDIMVAARNGADPAANSRLRMVMEQARKVSMPKDTLDRAIKKGAGLSGESVQFERVIYEGYAPHQVASDGRHIGVLGVEPDTVAAHGWPAALQAQSSHTAFTDHPDHPTLLRRLHTLHVSVHGT
jgi:hypothetical protein